MRRDLLANAFHTRQVARGRLHDLHAGADAAGERDQPHVLVCRQQRAAIASAGDEIEYALRQVALGQQLAEVEGVERRLFALLDHDGVARDQRRRRLACDQEEREVPGQDTGHHADRAPVRRDRFARTVAVQDFTLDAARQPRLVLAPLGCHGRECARHADLPASAPRPAARHAQRPPRGRCRGRRAYFSPSWTPFQADRGRHFSVIVDGVSD